MWHNLLSMQQHIEIFDGKKHRLLVSKKNMIFKLTWPGFPRAKT